MKEYSVVGMEDVREIERSSSFDAQFGNRQDIKTTVGSFKFVDIKPAGLADGFPLLVIPGWSITIGTEKQLLEDLCNAGKHTVSLEFPRFGGEVLEHESTPREVLRQAEIISELIKSRPEDKMDVVAQSMGAMDLIAAVKLHPELLDRIGSVVFVSPAGLTGNDNFFKLVARFAPHFAQDVTTALRSSDSRKNILRMMKESNIYITKNPLRAVVGEAIAIAGSDMYEGLKDFQNAGIKVGIIQGESDRLTPAKKLWGKIGDGSKSPFVKDETTKSGFRYEPKENPNPPLESITMVGGGHDNRMYGEPGFAKKILNQLDSLS